MLTARANPTFHMHLANYLANGAEILERHHPDNREHWIILARWHKGDRYEYVTWCVSDEGDCYWGHYHRELSTAALDYDYRRKRGF